MKTLDGQPTRVFLSKQECAVRYGIFDAAEIGKWKRRKWPLPPKFKVAVMIDGVVFEARSGEWLHSQILLREQYYGGEIEEGFTFEKP